MRINGTLWVMDKSKLLFPRCREKGHTCIQLGKKQLWGEQCGRQTLMMSNSAAQEQRMLSEIHVH